MQCYIFVRAIKVQKEFMIDVVSNESTVPALFSYARIPKFHTELYLNE